MPVTTEHIDYIKNVKKWQKLDDFLEGFAKKHIPDIVFTAPWETDPQIIEFNQHLNESYRDCARYTNFCLQTQLAIVGLIMSQPPILIQVPPELEYIKTDATGNKFKLNQLVAELCGSLLGSGRTFLITDYPRVDTNLDSEYVKNNKIVPRMYTFKAEQVSNWKVDCTNGTDILTMVTIKKLVDIPVQNDPYLHKAQLQYLVLTLDNDGYYSQTTYDCEGEPIPGKETFYPEKAGKKWTEIPITCLGSQANTVKINNMPLETILELSEGHLRLSAAYMDNIKRYCRGTPILRSSLPQKEVQAALKKRPLMLTAQQGLYVGETGGLDIAQLQSGQEAAAAMKDTVELISKAGGHIVSQAPANISFDTLKLNMSAQTSQAEMIVNNVEDAITQHLIWQCDFLGISSANVKFQMSRDFIKAIADPLVMGAILAQIKGGVAPQQMANDYNRKVDLLPFDMTDGQIKSQLDNENPTGQLSNFDNQNPNTPLPQNAIGVAKPTQALENKIQNGKA